MIQQILCINPKKVKIIVDNVTIPNLRICCVLQVLDALVSLFCRSDVSAEIRWVGGWLLRQLLPHGEEQLSAVHLERLKVRSKTSFFNLTFMFAHDYCILRRKYQA